GMDAPTRDIFYQELLADQEKHPRIMIISTHLVSEMDYLFEEILILHKGKMILQDDYESLLNKGAAITGEAKDVDDFVQDMEVLNVQELGPIKSAMVYGEVSKEMRKAAMLKGLEIGPISLHDLFVHLT